MLNVQFLVETHVIISGKHHIPDDINIFVYSDAVFKFLTDR